MSSRWPVAIVAVLAIAGCAGTPLDYPTVVAKAEQLLDDIFGTVPDESVASTTAGTHEHIACDAGFEKYDTWIAVTTATGFDEAGHLEGVRHDYVAAGWDDFDLDGGVRMLHPEGYLLDATAPDEGTLLFTVTSPCLAVPRVAVP